MYNYNHVVLGYIYSRLVTQSAQPTHSLTHPYNLMQLQLSKLAHPYNLIFGAFGSRL